MQAITTQTEESNRDRREGNVAILKELELIRRDNRDEIRRLAAAIVTSGRGTVRPGAANIRPPRAGA